MADLADSIPPEIKAVLLGFVEGATEFLPVSSTGHLVLFGEAINFSEHLAPAFDISIQVGAILAVIWHYKKDIREILFGNSKSFLIKLFFAFLPLAVLGFLFGKTIMHSLFSPLPVAVAFIVGGCLILLIEKDYEKKSGSSKINMLEEISNFDSFKIGLVQVLSLIPGTSRSGAVIIGGMYFGLSRHIATKFSFFLAIPVIVSAGIYSLFLSRSLISINEIPIFTLGFMSSFLSALFVIRWLISFVQKKSLKIFAWYRIIVGILILLIW